MTKRLTPLYLVLLGASITLSMAATQVTGGGGLQRVVHNARLSGDGTTAVPLDLSSSGVTAGSYTNTSLTVDVFGRVTLASSGSSGAVTTSSPISGDGSGGSPVTLANGAYGDVTVSSGTTWTVGSLPESRITGLTTDLAAKALGSTTLTATSPVRIDGSSSANLTAGRTLSVLSFSTSSSGVTTSSGTATNFLRGDNTWSTVAQTTAALDTFTSSLQGLTPSSGGGTTNFLRADGAWATPPAPTVIAGGGNFGDGSNGSPTFDGSSAVTGWTRSGATYSTTRPDWFYQTVTISSGVTLCMETGGEGTGGGASGRLFASVGIVVTSGTATIKLNGATPTTNTQATNMVTGHTGATTGQGAGGIQNAGQNAGNHSGGLWPNSFRAGAGGFGGASATNIGSNTAAVANSILGDAAGGVNTWLQSSLGAVTLNNPGRLAGGAGGGSGGGTTGIAAGGAGGNGGGVLIVGTRNVTGTLALQVKGGNGAPGVSAVGSNAGGGSGGGGGYVILGIGTSTLPVGVTLSASGGLGGSAQGAGTAGGSGGAGQTLVFALGPS